MQEFKKLFVLAALLLAGSTRVDGWYFRWQSLNQSTGSSCTDDPRSELNSHINEALVDILMHTWQKDAEPTAMETCDDYTKLTDSTFLTSSTEKVCLNPHSSTDVHFVQSYYSLLKISKQLKVIAAVPALLNYQDPSSSTMRGYLEQQYAPVLTSGPAQTELADAVYRLAVQRGWSYIAIVTEADVGAMRMSQALHDMAKMDQRVCFPLTVTFTSSNATLAAKSLKDFAYSKMTRLAVVYAGSGSTFLTLWDLVTGTDSSFTDSEKRYQFVLVGNALGSFHKTTDTVRRRHFGLGTIFIFPGIIDHHQTLATDQMAILIHNITSSPASMGEFSSLRDTWSRLQTLKTFTDSSCNSWREITSLCFVQALMYDYHLLSFLPLISTFPAGTTPDLSTSASFETLRQKSVTLSDLRAAIPFVDAFLEQNYTSYSFSRGLRHRDRGFWQPIVKVHQSQLASSEAKLVKLGELRVHQAGTVDQSYEWDFTGTPVFYQFTSANPENLPVIASRSDSVCPNNCPECSTLKGKQHVQFKHGDIYLGATLPVFNHGTDLYACSDGTFYSEFTEWSAAFRFVVELTNWVSQGAPIPPSGMDPTLVDNQFLLGVRDLLSRVHQGRTRKLSLGYVVLDSCYAAPYMTNNLALLLDGKLEPLIGLNYTKFVGFVGDASSTQTMAASQILKQYSLPIISHASTSTTLSDVFQYPFTMRTVASDNEVVEAMISIVKHYRVDLITVVYTPNAYGISLKDAMLSRASRDGICIVKLLVFDCGLSDDSCKRSLALQLRNAGTRYVAFLSDGSDLGNFFNYPQVESDLEVITIFATESFDMTSIVGKSNLGVGTTMVKLISAPEPAFLKYLNNTLTRLPENSNNLSQWDRLHFESANQCYLTDSFVRSTAYSQTCLPNIVNSHQVTQLDSRTAFLIKATETLILGSLSAIRYLCSVVTPEPACPAFFKGDVATQVQRANLIMYGQTTATGTTAQGFSGSYGGSEWSFQKIFDNRMGRTPMQLLQFRKIGSAEYRFEQFGRFDGVNSSMFTVDAEQLYKFERLQVASTTCRTAAQCGHPTCVNSVDKAICTDCGGSGGSSSLLGLLGLLFVPGVIVGTLIFWLLRRLVPAPNEPDYLRSDNSLNLQLSSTGQCGHGNDLYYEVTDSNPTVDRPLPTPP